jgi:hypothetical protein
MAGNFYDDPAHAAVNEHIYNLIRGGKRVSANELVGDAIGTIITRANPTVGALYELGRAALSKNNSNDQ